VIRFCQQRDFPYSNGCTDPTRQVALATKFCSMAPEICGSSVTRLAPEFFDGGTGSLENLCSLNRNFPEVLYTVTRLFITACKLKISRFQIDACHRRQQFQLHKH